MTRAAASLLSSALLLGFATMASVSCGSDESEPGGSGATSGTGAAAGAGASGGAGGGGASSSGASGGGAGGEAGSGAAGGGAIDAFNGDCSSAKWADVSDACWACLCGGCGAELNACDETCMELFVCTGAESCWVGSGDQILCEIRCLGNSCITDANRAGAGPLTAFDGCLLGSPDKGSDFRLCEAECGLTYPGDVCERFPE